MSPLTTSILTGQRRRCDCPDVHDTPGWFGRFSHTEHRPHKISDQVHLGYPAADEVKMSKRLDNSYVEGARWSNFIPHGHWLRLCSEPNRRGPRSGSHHRNHNRWACGLLRVTMTSGNSEKVVSVQPDGSFEFENVPPAQASFRTDPVHIESMIVNVENSDLKIRAT
jgi:hypothetical protein